MIRPVAALLLLVPLASVAAAQPAEDYAPLVAPLSAMLDGCLSQSWDAESAAACDGLTSRACTAMGPGGDTTYGMAQCTVILTDLWDAELNRLWPEVLAATAPEGDRMRREQRAWIAHRDAACAFEVARVEGGSMAAYVGGYCLMGMTAERVAHFRDILR